MFIYSESGKLTPGDDVQNLLVFNTIEEAVDFIEEHDGLDEADSNGITIYKVEESCRVVSSIKIIGLATEEEPVKHNVTTKRKVTV